MYNLDDSIVIIFVEIYIDLSTLFLHQRKIELNYDLISKMCDWTSKIYWTPIFLRCINWTLKPFLQNCYRFSISCFFIEIPLPWIFLLSKKLFYYRILFFFYVLFYWVMMKSYIGNSFFFFFASFFFCCVMWPMKWLFLQMLIVKQTGWWPPSPTSISFLLLL